MSTREQAKLQRRAAIVSAARALVRNTGAAGFSMRLLAEKAGVSVATPYNLFGSKQAIMLALLDAESEDFWQALATSAADEIDQFFAAVSQATALYAREPDFYRALLQAVYNDGGKEFRSVFGPAQHARWRGMVRQAIETGALIRATQADAMAVNLSSLFFSNILEWAFAELTVEELEARVHYGFALSLCAMAADPDRTRLHKRALKAQTRLAALWRARDTDHEAASAG
ncbi:MAG: TetR/AcrR family transcriptional regulator [Pseudomonadales bacterium]